MRFKNDQEPLTCMEYEAAISLQQLQNPNHSVDIHNYYTQEWYPRVRIHQTQCYNEKKTENHWLHTFKILRTSPYIYFSFMLAPRLFSVSGSVKRRDLWYSSSVSAVLHRPDRETGSQPLSGPRICKLKILVKNLVI